MSSEDEDNFLYGSDTENVGEISNDAPASKRQKTEAPVAEEPVSENNEGDDDDEEYSDSDSDVEFIIGTGNDTSKLSSGVSQVSVTPVVTSAVTEETVVETSAPVTTKPSGETAKIDINKVGQLDGQPITEIDPEVLKEKPWRAPGEDISDYFNYGFDEFTWMEYVNKQENVRQKFNSQRILMGLVQRNAPTLPGMPPLPPIGFAGAPTGPAVPRGPKRKQ